MNPMIRRILSRRVTDLLLQDLKHGTIREFKDINTMAVLNAHVDQGTLDIFVTLLDFYKLVVEELFFCLGEIVFRTNIVGANVYYLLRCFIRDYKVNPSREIKEWSDRIKELQTYIPFVSSKAWDKRRAAKQEFKAIEM